MRAPLLTRPRRGSARALPRKLKAKVIPDNKSCLRNRDQSCPANRIIINYGYTAATRGAAAAQLSLAYIRPRAMNKSEDRGERDEREIYLHTRRRERVARYTYLLGERAEPQSRITHYNKKASTPIRNLL